MGERPVENEVVETKTLKSAECYNGATNAGLEAKGREDRYETKSRDMKNTEVRSMKQKQEKI